MKPIILVAVLALAIGAALAKSSHRVAPNEKWYVAPIKHLSLKECKADFFKQYAGKCSDEGPDGKPLKKCKPEDRFTGHEFDGFCEWYGGSDIVAEDCAPGFHLERQLACYGFGAAEIPTARAVCHRDTDRGATDPCGLECAARAAAPDGGSP